MSKSDTYENGLLQLIFNAVTLSTLAENKVAGPATDLYVSLHSSDPGETGDQTSNEISYTGYARKAVARTSGGWTVSGSGVSNTAEAAFGACTAGSATATHFGVGVSISGSGYLLYKGALDASLEISAGITPKFAAGELDITED